MARVAASWTAAGARLTPLGVQAVTALLLGMVLAACATVPPPSPLTFREIQREDDVYRVTARWQGDTPADVEPRLLARCAEVARAEGAATFFIVNADFEVTNTVFLRQGSPVTPVFRVKEERGGLDARSATVTIKLFRPGKAPEGYRLYDVEAILRKAQPVSIRFGVSVGSGAGTGSGR